MAFAPGVFNSIAQAAQQRANQSGGSPTPSSSSSNSSNRQHDPNDPEIIEGIRLSDLNAVMQMQQKVSAIMSNPQLRATVDPTWLMALGVGVQRKTHEILGKLVGDNNVQTLTDAMQGKLFQGSPGIGAGVAPGFTPGPSGITGGIYGQQAYAQQLGDLQKKSNAMWQQKRGGEFSNMFEPDQNAKPDSKDQVSWRTRSDIPDWKQQLYGGSQPPAWFNALPVEQQLSLMGSNTSTSGSGSDALTGRVITDDSKK